MITTTKHSAVLKKSHRRGLCVVGESAILVDSLFQSYMDSWFINFPSTMGEP